MPQRVKQIDGLVIDEISLVDKGANQHATVTIAKADTGEEEQQMDIFDEQGNPLDPESLSDGDVVYGEDGSAYRYELDDEAAAEPQEQLVGKSADQDNPFRRDTPVAKSALTADLREELSKALTDRDRDEVVSKALTRLEELSKAAERAEEIAKAERTARLTREYTEIAKSYSLPIRDDVLGPVLMRCAENLSANDCSVIAKCLEAASENVFAEHGAIGGGDNSDVLSQAEAAISKAAGGVGAEGLAEFFAEHPEAYDEYLAEKRG